MNGHEIHSIIPDLLSYRILSRRRGCALALQAPPGQQAENFAGEVRDGRDWRKSLGTDWRFVLRHEPYGWTIAVLNPAGMDLTQLTPPWRFEPNPRQLFGWHFRNADNSGPNDGSVNAPQTRRKFLISPSLSGTGGFRTPADKPADPSAFEGEGHGTFVIDHYGLADLAPGQKARLTSIKFRACLVWPAQ